jgi:uncharacterized protein (TIGR03382 family)
MSGIFEAIASIATAAATEATARTAKRLVLGAAAVLCLLLGVGFAAAAGYEALAIGYGTLTAKLIVAGGFLLVGLIIFAVMAIQKSQRKRQAAESGPTTAMAVAFAMGLLSGLGRRRK